MAKSSKRSNERSGWHDGMHLMTDMMVGLNNSVISQTPTEAERHFCEMAIKRIEEAKSALERIILQDVADREEQNKAFHYLTELMQWAMHTGSANAHAAKLYMNKCDLRARREIKKEARGEDLVTDVVKEEAAIFWAAEPTITGSTTTAKRILTKVNDRLSALNADGKVAIAALDVSAIQKRIARMKKANNG